MFIHFLRRLSVRRRIVGSFVIMLLFLAMSIPLIATDHISLTGYIQQLTKVDAKSDRLLLTALARLLSSRVNLMRYADDLTPSTSDALADVKQAIQLVEEARSLSTAPAQKTSMANILAGLVSYSTLITDAQNARLENRQQDVTTLLSNSYRLEFDLEQQITDVVNKSEARTDASNSTTLGNAQLRLIFILASYIGLLILAIAMAIVVQQSITKPIFEMRQGAESFRSDRKATNIPSEGTDELSTLAQTFNQITSELAQAFTDLEKRVVERTKDLATVAEVGTATATILDTGRLLQEVVDVTKERFNLYHSHIYLLDDTGENLVLASGAGEPGRKMVAEKHSIPLNREQSLVARSARERKGVTINDVTQAPDFLPNPLLPDTRSELAVPMIVGGNLIGVFDIQSDQVGRFTDSDINIQTTLAAQLATSIQNVRSFEKSKKQAESESLVNAISQKIQRTSTMEETLQTAIRELGLALGATRVSAKISAPKVTGNVSGGN